MSTSTVIVFFKTAAVSNLVANKITIKFHPKSQINGLSAKSNSRKVPTKFVLFAF